MARGGNIDEENDEEENEQDRNGKDNEQDDAPVSEHDADSGREESELDLRNHLRDDILESVREHVGYI